MEDCDTSLVHLQLDLMMMTMMVKGKAIPVTGRAGR
jgi:hypothetical protein